MTRPEQVALDALAKAVTTGTDGRFPCWTDPFLVETAQTLAAQAWQATETCFLCPRRMDRHTCSCPHAQAKKRLRRFGVWPEEA